MPTTPPDDFVQSLDFQPASAPKPVGDQGGPPVAGRPARLSVTFSRGGSYFLLGEEAAAKEREIYKVLKRY